MGVDYCAISGYGFAIPEAGIQPLAHWVGFEYDQDEGIEAYEFGEWLTKDTMLGYDIVGDLMGGEDIYLLVLAPATTKEVSWRYSSGLTKFGENPVTEREQHELEVVYDRLYGEGSHDEGYIGWMLAMTVS